jgi:hypothetical protein
MIHHDKPRAIHQQLYLVAAEADQLAAAVLELLGELKARNSSAPTETVKSVMQMMNRRIVETDVFMSGYIAGEHK